MQKCIELSPMEVKLGFVASCVEFAAHAMGLSYDVLHTYSREHVTDDVVGCLTEWEGRV